MGDSVNLIANVIPKLDQAAAAKVFATLQAQSSAMQKMLGGGMPNQTQASAMLRNLSAQNTALNLMNKGLGEAGTRASYLSVRLSSFALYRGFVFLEQGIMSSTRAMIDLDHEISLVMTQLPNFGAGLRGALTDKVVQVAIQTGTSFQEVAKSLYEITSAGYSGAEAMKALELSAKAATAGGTDATSAFQSAFSQLSAFGLGIDKLSEVYDKQFNLVKRGIFNYQQLTTVVGITAEAAVQAGQSLETNNAALAAMSEVFTGPQLRRGATALRSLFNEIAESPDKFAKLGVATRDMSGNIRDLIPILDDLKARTEGMTTGEKGTLFATILPDQRERVGVIALLQNLDDLKRNYVEQKLALGSLDEAYKTVRGDIATQTQALKDNLQRGFQPLAKTVGTAFEGMNNVEKVLPGITSSLILMTTAALAASIAYGKLSESVTIAGVQMSRGAAMMQGLRSPGMTRAAAGIGGFALGGAIESSQGGFSLGGLGAAAGAGALTGGAFGAIGAGGTMGTSVAIGAAIGGIASALSYGISAWSDSAKKSFEDGGKTFGEAFAQSLKDNKGDISLSTKEALGIVTGGASRPKEDLASRDLLAEGAPGGTTRGLLGDIAAGWGNILRGMGDATDRAFYLIGEKEHQFLNPDPTKGSFIEQLRGGISEAMVGPNQALVGGAPIAPTPEVPLTSTLLKVREEVLAAIEDVNKPERVAEYAAAALAMTANGRPTTAEQVKADTLEGKRKYAIEEGALKGNTSGQVLFNTVMAASDSLEGFTKLLDDYTSGTEAGKKAFIDAIASYAASQAALGNSLDDASKAVDKFAEAITRNTDEVNVIRTRAAAQGRGLTGEEVRQINSLEYGSAQLKYQSDTGHVMAANGFSGIVRQRTNFTVGESGPEMVTVSPLLRRLQPDANGNPFHMAMGRRSTPLGLVAPFGGPSDLNLYRSGLFSSMSSGVRSYDERMMTLGTARRLSEFAPDLMTVRGNWTDSSRRQRGMDAALGAMFAQQQRSSERGGQVNYFNFNGDSVPSEMDLTVQQLRRVGPLMVRARGRAR